MPGCVQGWLGPRWKCQHLHTGTLDVPASLHSAIPSGGDVFSRRSPHIPVLMFVLRDVYNKIVYSDVIACKHLHNMQDILTSSVVDRGAIHIIGKNVKGNINNSFFKN